jgi:hypothetical protein
LGGVPSPAYARRVRRLLLLPLITLALSACGGPPTEEAKVRDVIAAYHRAVADHDADAFCAFLAPELLAKARGDCAALAAQVLASAPDASRSPDISKVTITGDIAVAESPYEYQKITLQRVQGHWFVNPLR